MEKKIKNNVYMYILKSYCWTEEINTKLQINCTLIKY